MGLWFESVYLISLVSKLVLPSYFAYISHQAQKSCQFYPVFL